ncbi:MAG: hypothetical protein AB7T06_20515, partial [Kofleriaceae bacterium]
GVPLDSTTSGVPAAPLRWKPFAIGGAIFVLVIILIGVTRGGSTTAGSTTTSGPTMSGVGPTSPPPDEPIEIADPPMLEGKSEKDWHKVVEHIERGKYREARKKLGEWERKYGSTPETASLREQLANRADDDHRGPPGRRHDD